MSVYRRVSHSTAIFGDMSRAAQLPQPVDDTDMDLISWAQEQQRQALRDSEKVNDHCGKWLYLEYKRENIFAEITKRKKDEQALFDAEREDPQLAAARDAARKEIDDNRRRCDEGKRNRNLECGF
jgi:hypothetical protein